MPALPWNTANPPCHADWIADGKHGARIRGALARLDILQNHPAATHGSIDHGEESRFRNNLGWPGCDRLVAATGQRGEHDQSLLYTVRQRCNGVEPCGRKHRVIIGRRKTRKDFRGNTVGTLLPGFPGRGGS